MKEQMLRQAPHDATGYALVLPAAQEGESPKIVPRRKRGEDRAPYRLSPFDYPLDIRLRDATWYRILWFGKNGQQVPPPSDTGIPSLYFFLGAAEHTALREFTKRQEPLALSDGAFDADKTKRLAPPEATSETQEATISPQTEPVEPAPQSPPEQSSAPAPVNEPRESPAPVPASKNSPQKIHPFWSAEGKCLLHVESLAQLLYEERAALAKKQGQTAPTEPLTQLSGDERKKIRRMAKHPAMVELGRSLVEHIASVQSEGIDVLESLPLNIEARSPPEQHLLREAHKHPDKRKYVDYLYQRARALLAGEPHLAEPTTALSVAERKQLTKLVFDLRSLSTIVKISDGGLGT